MLVTFNHMQLRQRHLKKQAEAKLDMSEKAWIKLGAFFQPLRPDNRMLTPWLVRCSIQSDGNALVEEGEEENPFGVVVYADYEGESSLIVFDREDPLEYLEWILKELKSLGYIQDNQIISMGLSEHKQKTI